MFVSCCFWTGAVVFVKDLGIMHLSEVRVFLRHVALNIAQPAEAVLSIRPPKTKDFVCAHLTLC